MNKAAIEQVAVNRTAVSYRSYFIILGIADDQIDSEQVRNMIKAGKRIERIDMFARLKVSQKGTDKRGTPHDPESGKKRAAV